MGASGVEGIVAKALGSPYRSGSTWSWRKVRHAETVDAEPIGLVGPADRPRALLVRLPDGRTLTTTLRLTPAHPGSPRHRRGRSAPGWPGRAAG
ncbi:hypothetical protein ACFQ8C_26115 [Streptomyces sp. NPDC056503]|uniref:hypothetical protein n=1 Tax=Streptomyces sp. NPDC056503 TaxID=3345842 RepID=UPI0036D1764D